MYTNQSQKLKSQLTFATLKREKYTYLWLKNNDLKTLKILIKQGLIYSYSIGKRNDNRIKVYIIFNGNALGKKVK